jgi:hypothetical protein
VITTSENSETSARPPDHSDFRKVVTQPMPCVTKSLMEAAGLKPAPSNFFTQGWLWSLSRCCSVPI